MQRSPDRATNSFPAEVTETHSSIVMLIGDRAWKIKKPVDLGFLDFTTLDARRIACRRETELNRRLAPDVYLGVADVVGPDGVVCEHAVVMKRMPGGRRLSACLERNEDVGAALRVVAREVAALHDSHPTDPRWAYVGTTDHLAGLWDDGFTLMEDLCGEVFDQPRVRRAQELAQRYLSGRAPLFEKRIDEGRIRDGHGDLQADDIFVLDDGPRVLDCLDFSDELRWGDVLLDVSFLAMDLERLGRPDLGARFLDWHREFAADTWPRSLAHHYVAYRASVRARVTGLRHVQGDAGAAPRARELFDLMARHLDAGSVRVVVVGGLPGTGKSTLAAALADPLQAVVLRTDELRAGDRGRHDAFAEGRYAPAAVSATYETMLHQARALLSFGESVILDASWADPSYRILARDVAREAGADIVEFRCDVDPAVARSRLRTRQARGADASEATPEVADAMAHHFAAWPEATHLRTDSPVAELVDEALRRLRIGR